jgi:hypothetical protein
MKYRCLINLAVINLLNSIKMKLDSESHLLNILIFYQFNVLCIAVQHFDHLQQTSLKYFAAAQSHKVFASYYHHFFLSQLTSTSEISAKVLCFKV